MHRCWIKIQFANFCTKYGNQKQVYNDKGVHGIRFTRHLRQNVPRNIYNEIVLMTNIKTRVTLDWKEVDFNIVSCKQSVYYNKALEM